MTDEQQIRVLLGPADPARGVTVPLPSATATQLIARIAPARTRLPGRRLVLAGGLTAAVAAVTAYALPREPRTGSADGTPIGEVVVPIAYEFDTNPRPAAPQLRALAARARNAPYDGRTGRYAYRHGKSWSPTTVSSEDRLAMGYVEEEHMWTAPDGSSRQRRIILAVQYPNEESRRFWEPTLARSDHPRLPHEEVMDLPPQGDSHPADAVRPADRTRPPTSYADLAVLLKTQYGAYAANKDTMELYRYYVVPRQARAQVLLVLADLKGYVWRGAVRTEPGAAGWPSA